MTLPQVPTWVRDRLMEGLVIPAHVLALNEQLQIDTVRQRGLTRYFLDAGSGGLAVGVHTTQFAIREVGLYEPVLKLAATASREWARESIVLVAGVTGRTDQAIGEADAARSAGYHAALLNVAAFRGASEDEILEHCRSVAAKLPLIGFYLLREVGGILLSYRFWREFFEIENVLAVKLAPFNRYHTYEVIRALVDARAEERVALYTGNDDHIVLDLTTPFDVPRDGGMVRVYMRGGLLGHWSVWTKRANELLHRIKVERETPSADLLALDGRVTDCNGAIYDAWNDLKGAIPGCHYVLRRQGLMKSLRCLDPNEVLSPGQAEEIERVYRDHPDMNDDAFVGANLERWIDS